MTKNNGTAIVPEKENLSAFELADKQRYKKLAAAPSLEGEPYYPALNLDGTTLPEILGLTV